MEMAYGTSGTSNWKNFGSSLAAIALFGLSFALWSMGAAMLLLGMGMLGGSGILAAGYFILSQQWVFALWALLAVPAGATLASLLLKIKLVRALLEWAVAGPAAKLELVK